jgi:hypothetical protein
MKVSTRPASSGPTRRSSDRCSQLRRALNSRRRMIAVLEPLHGFHDNLLL